MVVVQLRQAGSQLAAAGSGSGDHNDGLGGLDVFVGAVAFVADDGVDLGRVTLGETVGVHLDAAAFQFVLKSPGGELARKTGDDHRAQRDAPGGQIVDQLQGVGIIGDAEVGADLFPFDVTGEDAQQDVGLVLELLQQPHLHVGVETREHPWTRGNRRAACPRTRGRVCCERNGPVPGWPRFVPAGIFRCQSLLVWACLVSWIGNDR